MMEAMKLEVSWTMGACHKQDVSPVAFGASRSLPLKVKRQIQRVFFRAVELLAGSGAPVAGSVRGCLYTVGRSGAKHWRTVAPWFSGRWLHAFPCD